MGDPTGGNAEGDRGFSNPDGGESEWEVVGGWDFGIPFASVEGVAGGGSAGEEPGERRSD
jgi:hypothetical protein